MMRSLATQLGKSVAAAFLLLLLVLVSQASATWKLNLTGDVGYSIGEGDVTGSSVWTNDFSGSDDDVSPLMGAAVGIEVPMFELTPWRLPWNLQLPDWPVRLEIEVVGLREYELQTDGLTSGAPFDSPFHTKVKFWTIMHDVWLDVPLRWMHQPITWVGERVQGRRPRYAKLKKFLDASNFYFGAGIGMGRLEVSTSEPDLAGSKNDYNFAYQFGAGYGYRLTERVHMSVGYRYVNPGDAKITLYDNVGTERGRFELENDIHEIRFAVRVTLADLPNPWR